MFEQPTQYDLHTQLGAQAEQRTASSGLIEQIAANCRREERKDHTADPQQSTVVCADGYVRRTPVQAYYTPKGYYKRMRRKIVLYGTLMLLAVWGVTSLIIYFW